MTDLQEYGKVSDCCGAPVIFTDMCSICYERCYPIDEFNEETNEALDSVTDFEQLT